MSIFVILENMKMKRCCLLLLYFGLTYCQGALADNQHDVKRGMYPYMAFIYYSDPSVVDATHHRFIRSAVLIRPDWLITTALGPSIDAEDPSYGFPKKTLLARTGAITIDEKFTLNEDEDEQEREIIQIVRPFNHTATQWWTTDISLMKTLVPFNMSSAVGIKVLNTKPDVDAKICSILVYAKKVNTTEDKTLMMLYVEMLPPSIENCGSHFSSNTMACASDSDENKDTTYDMDFCQGNSGGPLICDHEVKGLQTYIGDNCKQPHLYQLLHAWDNFITCGIEDKCQEEHCSSICVVNYKDPPKAKVTPPVTHDTSRDLNELLNIPLTPAKSKDLSLYSSEPSVYTEIIDNTVPTMTKEDEFMTTEDIPLTTITETEPTTSEIITTTTTFQTTTTTSPEEMTVKTSPKEETTTEIVTTTKRPKEKETTRSQQTEWPKVRSTTWPADETKDTTWAKETKLAWLGEPQSWPKEKLTHDDSGKYREDDENPDRQASVEAQHHEDEPQVKKRTTSSSNKNMCVIQTLLFGLMLFVCL